jgi:hypothetical protein
MADEEVVALSLVGRAGADGLEACSGLDPLAEGGVQLTAVVKSVATDPVVVDNGAGRFNFIDTSVTATTAVQGQPCSVALVFRSARERPALQTGTTIRVVQRTIHRSDTDIPGVVAVFDEDSRLLYGVVLSASPERFQEDFTTVFPSLTVKPGTQSQCKLPDGQTSLTAATVSTGTSSCQLDSRSSGCCKLWDRDYEVQLLYATLAAGKPRALGFALRLRGFLATAK